MISWYFLVVGGLIGAGGGSRTRLSCLGSTHNTDILRPHQTVEIKPIFTPSQSRIISSISGRRPSGVGFT